MYVVGTSDRSIDRKDSFRCPLLLSLTLLTLLITTAELTAQDSQGEERVDWRIGLTLIPGLSTHSVDLDIYQGFPGCGLFQDQISTKLEGRIFVERPLSRVAGMPLDLVVAISLQDRSFSFSRSFASPGRTSSGQERTIVTQHRFDATLYGLGGMLGVALEPVEGVRLLVAPTLLFVGDRDTRQYERVVSPLGATFTETGDFERPVDRGAEVAFRSIVPALSLWGGARFVTGADIGLEPGIGLQTDLTAIAEGYPWRTTTVGIGISIFRQKVVRGIEGQTELLPPSLAVIEPTPPPAPPELPDEAPWLEARIVAWGIDAEGNRYADPVIEIREAPFRQAIPILPYIFFDSGSARIPERYLLLESREAADRFNTDSLLSLTPLRAYHHLPNILGARLRLRPEVSMTIVGTRSADEPSDLLAQARADSLRNYFVRIWGIDPRRLTTRSGEPTLPSSRETSQGRAENRRVEFRFDGESLLNPVIVHRLARIASPPAVTFEKEVIADTGIASMVVRVMQGGKELIRFDERNSEGRQSRFWPLSELRVNRDLTPVVYRFEVTDSAGGFAFDQGEFRVRERVRREGEREMEVEEYLLAGFVYNSADLSPAHVAAIYEIARVAAESNGWVEIVGYTDEVGDDQRNRRLALDRAERVAAMMREAVEALDLDGRLDIRTHGSGEIGAGEFDNGLPEGRIFSRMVRVTVHRSGE